MCEQLTVSVALDMVLGGGYRACWVLGCWGTEVLGYWGAVVQWCWGAGVLWCCGAGVLWCCGAVVQG